MLAPARYEHSVRDVVVELYGFAFNRCEHDKYRFMVSHRRGNGENRALMLLLRLGDNIGQSKPGKRHQRELLRRASHMRDVLEYFDFRRPLVLRGISTEFLEDVVCRVYRDSFLRGIDGKREFSCIVKLELCRNRNLRRLRRLAQAIHQAVLALRKRFYQRSLIMPALFSESDAHCQPRSE